MSQFFMPVSARNRGRAAPPEEAPRPVFGKQTVNYTEKPNKADIFVDIQRATLYNYCCSARIFFGSGPKNVNCGAGEFAFPPAVE